jgi:hypothetical protein
MLRVGTERMFGQVIKMDSQQGIRNVIPDMNERGKWGDRKIKNEVGTTIRS